MGKVLSEIGPNEKSFILKQRIFFVATAPLSGDHHVSVSPKANDQPPSKSGARGSSKAVTTDEKSKDTTTATTTPKTANDCVDTRSAIAVLDPHTVAYADLVGSGSETAAHVYENGRMTLMFCNLESGGPKILRLFGTARVILAEQVSADLKRQFSPRIVDSIGFRAVYVLHVSRISTSCGYSLPIFDFQKYRSVLIESIDKMGQQGIDNYSIEHNSYSIDGLPSIALRRSDAPKDVQPVQEQGYFLGKSMIVSSNEEHGGIIEWRVVASMKRDVVKGITSIQETMNYNIIRRPFVSILSALLFGMAIGYQLSSVPQFQWMN